MIRYLAMRILENAYTYSYVISRRPDLKEALDLHLMEIERDDLIVD